MKIEIEKNLLDKITFEKNHNLIHNKKLQNFNVKTIGTIGIGDNFNFKSGSSNIGKSIINVSSKHLEQNAFKLVIEKVIIFKISVDNISEEITINDAIELISKETFDSLVDEAENILKQAGLENIKLKTGINLN
ncbi:MAG: hypothetical protein ACRDAQ_10065 [Cetobacterium sp.]